MKTLFAFIFTLFTLIASAQSAKISGVVSGVDNLPVPFVSVSEKGTTNFGSRYGEFVVA